MVEAQPRYVGSRPKTSWLRLSLASSQMVSNSWLALPETTNTGMSAPRVLTRAIVAESMKQRPNPSFKRTRLRRSA